VGGATSYLAGLIQVRVTGNSSIEQRYKKESAIFGLSSRRNGIAVATAGVHFGALVL
jgi:hypothetical protein